MAIKTTPRYDNDAIKDELSKSGKSVREITPSPNFLTILESSGYKVHEALCDIIDNSIDAEATNILLTLGAENKKPYVIISDNGYGMTPDILFGALVLGASAAELGGRKKNGGSHGKYGTGMKSSMAELQGKNIIYTKVKGGELIKVHYDKNTIQEYWDKNGAWGITIENGTPEDVKFFSEETNNSQYGTVIKIYDIERYNVTANTGKISSIKPKLGQVYRRYINNGGITFKVNDVEVESFDPCGYDIPFRYNGKIYKSESMNEIELTNLEYIDSDGKKKRDGYLRYRSFLLPQRSDIDEIEIVKKFGWNMHNQGITVMRTNREVQGKGWLGMAITDPYLNRFKVEVDFTGEMDIPWNVDFKKTSVDPKSYIISKFQNQFEADAARARKLFKPSNSPKSVPASINKGITSISNFLKRVENLISKLPGKSKKQDPNNLGKGPKRGKYKQRQVTDKILFTFRDDMTGWRWYKTHTLDSQKRTVEIEINVNHPYYEHFKTVDIRNFNSMALEMFTRHFGRQDALEYITSIKEREMLMLAWEREDDKMGDMLAKLYPLSPKV